MAVHADIDRWSLLMHRHIADRIESGDREPIRKASANLARWEKQHGGLAPALLEWIDILEGSTDRLVALLREETENATRIRSSSPFAGAIDQRLRLELLREARAA